MMVRDVTTRKTRKPAKQKQTRKADKVLVTDFKVEELALLAKRCARMATCTINMFPDNKLFAWGLFSDTLKVMAADGSADDMARYLLKITRTPKRQQLITFVCSASVCLAFLSSVSV